MSILVAAFGGCSSETFYAPDPGYSYEHQIPFYAVMPLPHPGVEEVWGNKTRGSQGELYVTPAFEHDAPLYWLDVAPTGVLDETIDVPPIADLYGYRSALTESGTFLDVDGIQVRHVAPESCCTDGHTSRMASRSSGFGICGIVDGIVQCNRSGGNLMGYPAREVGAGGRCIITPQGALRCMSTMFPEPPSDRTYHSLRALGDGDTRGIRQFCALDEDGHLHCWVLAEDEREIWRSEYWPARANWTPPDEAYLAYALGGRLGRIVAARASGGLDFVDVDGSRTPVQPPYVPTEEQVPILPFFQDEDPRRARFTSLYCHLILGCRGATAEGELVHFYPYWELWTETGEDPREQD